MKIEHSSDRLNINLHIGLSNFRIFHSERFSFLVIFLISLNVELTSANLQLEHESYKKTHPDEWDFANCFSVYMKFWESVFSKEYSNANPKSYIFLIKNFRNQWAHNYSFTLRDAYRVADTIQLFFDMIQAPTEEINLQRLIILDSLF